jgi:hypothetical protein
MTGLRKSYAEVVREALVAAGLRAPNQRLFKINDDYAWELFRPAPSMLPEFPRHVHNPVERDGS